MFINKFDRKKFEEELKEIGIEYDPKAFKAGLWTKLLLKFNPIRGLKSFNRERGIDNDIFDKLHEIFSKIERVDLFPLKGKRGFILVLDQKTALFFYQDGDNFKYDGFEMGEYAKGDVTVFDHIPEDLSDPYDL